jgi:hypothetical protein
MIEWIYNLQVHPLPASTPSTSASASTTSASAPAPASGSAAASEPDYRRCGFRGSTVIGQPFDPKQVLFMWLFVRRFKSSHFVLCCVVLCGVVLCCVVLCPAPNRDVT